MKFLTQKNLLIAITLFVVVLLAVIFYRMFMQFNGKDVAIYIEEAAKAYDDKAMASKIILDGVEHILSSHNLTQQVIKSSKASKTPKEQELVHAALMQAKAFGYLG